MSAPDVQTPVGGPASADQMNTDDNTVGDGDAQRKRLANISAYLALNGFALHQLSCGGYLISRWDRTSFAPDLRCAEAFLQMVTGKAGRS